MEPAPGDGRTLSSPEQGVPGLFGMTSWMARDAWQAQAWSPPLPVSRGMMVLVRAALLKRVCHHLFLVFCSRNFSAASEGPLPSYRLSPATRGSGPSPAGVGVGWKMRPTSALEPGPSEAPLRSSPVALSASRPRGRRRRYPAGIFPPRWSSHPSSLQPLPLIAALSSSSRALPSQGPTSGHPYIVPTCHLKFRPLWGLTGPPGI